MGVNETLSDSEERGESDVQRKIERQRKSSQTPPPYLCRLTDFVLITAQKAANSQRTEKQGGIPGEMFTHLVVPCRIPLCRSQQGAEEGMLYSLIPMLCSLLNRRSLSRLTLSRDLPEGTDSAKFIVKLGHTAVRANPF